MPLLTSHTFLEDLAMVLCVAAITTVIFQKIRQPVVVGYLLAGLIVGPHITIIPLLAAGSTYVQAKMMQQPPNPLASEQELQAQQMTKSMSMMMPLMIAYFAIVTPAGLGLYWFISNCVAIIQQYFVTGWGQLPIPGRGSGS